MIDRSERSERDRQHDRDREEERRREEVRRREAEARREEAAKAARRLEKLNSHLRGVQPEILTRAEARYEEQRKAGRTDAEAAKEAQDKLVREAAAAAAAAQREYIEAVAGKVVRKRREFRVTERHRSNSAAHRRGAIDFSSKDSKDFTHAERHAEAKEVSRALGGGYVVIVEELDTRGQQTNTSYRAGQKHPESPRRVPRAATETHTHIQPDPYVVTLPERGPAHDHTERRYRAKKIEIKEDDDGLWLTEIREGGWSHYYVFDDPQRDPRARRQPPASQPTAPSVRAK